MAKYKKDTEEQIEANKQIEANEQVMKVATLLALKATDGGNEVGDISDIMSQLKPIISAATKIDTQDAKIIWDYVENDYNMDEDQKGELHNLLEERIVRAKLSGKTSRDMEEHNIGRAKLEGKIGAPITEEEPKPSIKPEIPEPAAAATAKDGKNTISL